jgi:hypothetical protein
LKSRDGVNEGRIENAREDFGEGRERTIGRAHNDKDLKGVMKQVTKDGDLTRMRGVRVLNTVARGAKVQSKSREGVAPSLSSFLISPCLSSPVILFFALLL